MAQKQGFSRLLQIKISAQKEITSRKMLLV
jgi:hypothetical protein